MVREAGVVGARIPAMTEQKTLDAKTLYTGESHSEFLKCGRQLPEKMKKRL
jgi:hypothetical protein